MSIWWSLHLRREAASIPLARRLLIGAMETAGVDPDISFDLSVALSEACANAVEHGGGAGSGGPAGGYRVTAYLDGEKCRIEVSDSGPGFPAGSARHGRGCAHGGAVGPAAGGARTVPQGAEGALGRPTRRQGSQGSQGGQGGPGGPETAGTRSGAPGSTGVPAGPGISANRAADRPLERLGAGQDRTTGPGPARSETTPARPDPGFAAATAESGRGLCLIEELADHVHFSNRPGRGAVVSFDKILKWREDALLKVS